MYLNYNEYTAMGGVLDSSAFARLEMKARHKIDYYTSNGLKAETPTEDIKMLMFELINLISVNEENGTERPGNIASVSNDGYSVSYSNDNDLFERQVYNLIFTYASQYMYRGVDSE